MFQLPFWPAHNQRASSVAALKAVVNVALGAGGGAEAVLVVPSGADATAEINARLEAMAVAGGGTMRVRRGRIGDPVRLDARVQLRGDDCTLIFDSPIVMGATGSLRIKGDLDKYWRGALDPASGTRVESSGDLPKVSIDTSDNPATGNHVVQFSAASGFVGQFQPGEMIVLRGFLSPARLAAIEKQFAFVASGDLAGNRLLLDRPCALHTRAEDAAEMRGASLRGGTMRSRHRRSATVSPASAVSVAFFVKASAWPIQKRQRRRGGLVTGAAWPAGVAGGKGALRIPPAVSVHWRPAFPLPPPVLQGLRSKARSERCRRRARERFGRTGRLAGPKIGAIAKSGTPLLRPQNAASSGSSASGSPHISTRV
jgi:hypothetical protein